MGYALGAQPQAPYDREQFPRAANAIADSWNDVTSSVQVIDQLLIDYRGDRRELSMAVQVELKALQEYL